MKLELGSFLGQPAPIVVEDIAMVVVLRKGVARLLPGRAHELGALGDRRDLHAGHDCGPEARTGLRGGWLWGPRMAYGHRL